MYDDIDDTPFGRDGDHCPWCGADWKRPHYEDCEQAHQCEYPPGCSEQTRLGRRLCDEHHAAVKGLFENLTVKIVEVAL